MEFTVERIGAAWAVTTGDVIHAKRHTKNAALAEAIRAAHEAASPHLRSFVTLEEGDEDAKRLVWDPTRDSFSEA